jgi:hypothetical protein
MAGRRCSWPGCRSCSAAPRSRSGSLSRWIRPERTPGHSGRSWASASRTHWAHCGRGCRRALTVSTYLRRDRVSARAGARNPPPAARRELATPCPPEHCDAVHGPGSPGLRRVARQTSSGRQPEPRLGRPAVVWWWLAFVAQTVVGLTRRTERAIGSDGAYVLGSRTLGAAPLGVGHSLVFVQRIERGALDARHVEEKVTPLVGLDETKPSVRQSFNRSFSHWSSSSAMRHALRIHPVQVCQKGWTTRQTGYVAPIASWRHVSLSFLRDRP